MTPSHARSRRSRRGRRLPAPGPAIRLAAALCLLPAAMLVAQKAPAQQVTRPVAPAIQTSFGDFHGLTATIDYLQKVAAARPGLTELIEIGRSAGNRPIYVLVLSNMKTGTTIDKLVPLRHPRTPAVNNVVPMKPYQGKPGQWIDGGMHVNERVGTEACLYIIDKLVSGYGSDPEITKLVDDNVFYIVPVVNPDAFAAVAEGKAAARNVAADTNGNFPEGWWKDDNTPGGLGDYPSSLPEARAILEFFTNHTNILLVQSFAAGGATTYRPFARWPETRLDARDVAVLDRLIGKKYLEIVGDKAGAWRSPYTGTPAGFGVFFDWAYGQFGAYAMSTQLPDAQRDTLAKVCDAAWQFERFKATLLPRMQIVDATAKVLYTTNQAARAQTSQDGNAVVVKKTAGTPGRYRVVQVTATIENSGQLPTGIARGAQLRGNREDVIWLLGDKVTFLEGARWQRLGLVQGTAAQTSGGRAETAEPGVAGARSGGRGRGGAGGGELALAQMREQRPPDTPAVSAVGNRRSVRWLVAIDGDGPLRLALTSQRGGTQVKDLAIQ